MTKDKGRGVFSSNDFKKGELIVVERSATAQPFDINEIGHKIKHQPTY